VKVVEEANKEVLAEGNKLHTVMAQANAETQKIAKTLAVAAQEVENANRSINSTMGENGGRVDESCTEVADDILDSTLGEEGARGNESCTEVAEDELDTASADGGRAGGGEDGAIEEGTSTHDGVLDERVWEEEPSIAEEDVAEEHVVTRSPVAEVAGECEDSEDHVIPAVASPPPDESADYAMSDQAAQAGQNGLDENVKVDVKVDVKAALDTAAEEDEGEAPRDPCSSTEHSQGTSEAIAASLIAEEAAAAPATGQQDKLHSETAPAPKSLQDRVAENKTLAWDMMSRGDSAGAVHLLTEALRIKPEDAEVYSSRALVYLQAGQMAEAITDLEVCIRLDPNDPKTFLRLANLCIGYGDIQRAIPAIRQGHAMHPDDAELATLLQEYTTTVKRQEDEIIVGDEAASHENSGHSESRSLPAQSSPTQHSVLSVTSMSESVGGRDYRWQRSTFSGRWYTPNTSSFITIEARQRKIREKCVEQNRRKQQKLVQKRQSIMDALAAQAEFERMEARKAATTQQLDLVYDCISIIENENLVAYGKFNADPKRRGTWLPRFAQTEDVVVEILVHLESAYPTDEHGRWAELEKLEPKLLLKRKAQMVEDAIHHVVELSTQPVKYRGLGAYGSIMGSLKDVMQHIPQKVKYRGLGAYGSIMGSLKDVMQHIPQKPSSHASTKFPQTSAPGSTFFDVDAEKQKAFMTDAVHHSSLPLQTTASANMGVRWGFSTPQSNFTDKNGLLSINTDELSLSENERVLPRTRSKISLTAPTKMPAINHYMSVANTGNRATSVKGDYLGQLPTFERRSSGSPYEYQISAGQSAHPIFNRRTSSFDGRTSSAVSDAGSQNSEMSVTSPVSQTSPLSSTKKL